MNERDRALELINAEVDGELDGPARAELSRRLLADAGLRALRDETRATCAAIDALPSEDPPLGLRASIMETLPASPPVCQDRDVHPPGGHSGRPVLRYAAAFAGGLLVSALAFQFAVRDARFESGELSGTIAAVTADASTLELHLDEVSGTVRVEGPAPVLVAELVAARPVQVIARLDGEEIRLAGFNAPQQDPTPVRAEFVRRSANQSRSRVEVSIVDVASGAVLQTTVLRPSVAPGEK